MGLLVFSFTSRNDDWIMIILQANKLDKYYGVQQVLQGVSFTVNQGDRAGVVGPNGAGKTTLLRCLTGEAEPDGGEISLANGIKMGYLEQLSAEEAGVTAWEAVMESFSDLLQLRAEMRAAEQQMSQEGADLESLYARYARITQQYEQDNGYACEAMARRVLVGLGFASDDFARPWHSFSGGEQTRINLARLLVRSPDLLLLDEPTNHLDLAAVEWLESFLSAYQGTLVVVSHDRRFLDQVANRIIEVRPGQVRTYPGNYTAYLKLKAEQDLAAQRAYEKQQEYIRRTEEYIARYRAGIKSKQARGRQSQLNRLERVANVAEGQHIFLHSEQPNVVSGEIVIEATDLEFGFAAKPLFSQVSFLLRRGDRVALVGSNGAGKTTLLKLLLGELQPCGGEVRWGSRIKTAYLAQHNEDLNPEHTLLQSLLDSTDFTNEQARNKLASMGFGGDEVNKMVTSLSGGERMRLALLKVMAGQPNLLILDEPTNHLDIESREVVEDMLDEFAGTLLLVSHDRYLLDRVVDTVMELKDGALTVYGGNYSYYRERLASQEREQRDKESKSTRENKKPAEESEQLKKERQRRRRLQADLNAYEAEINQQEAEKAELEASLSDPLLYGDEDKARELTARYRQVSEKIEELYATWADLQEQLDNN